MAKGLNRPINVQANLSFDTLQAKAQLTSLKKDINKLTSDLSLTSSNGQLGITKELTQAVKMTSQLQSILRSSTNDITGNLDLTKFNDSLRRTGTTLKDYQTTLNALGDNGAKAFNNLNKAIIGAETPLLRTTAAAKETLNTLGNTVRWQATSSLIHGVMGTAQQAMNYVKKLDSSLNSIQIVTGKNAATMADFARQANEAAKSLSTTTNEYAKAALIYYQQGLSDQQVQGRVATTLKMANVSGQTAAKVSDQMTSIWNNFYNGSKSLEYYADVMTALGASTASSSKEIAQGLSKFSSIAQTTGLSYEYATSALATITAATRQSADTVGTSLKTLFSRLQGLSLGETLDDGTTLNKYSKALDTIGINIKEANGELKSMDSILNEIGGKWQSLSKDTQVALSQTIGGVRNYTSLLTLMNNWDTFRTNLNTARTSEGTLQKQAEIYADSWEAASTRVRAASESIYKNLIDDTTFKAVTNKTADVLNLVGKATDAIGGFRGILLSTAGIASQLFGEEISTSLSNVGYNIKSVLGGQKEIQQLRQDALMNLLTPTSRTGTIMNEVETSLNKNLVNRISTYQSKVESGKIADWQTAAYSQILQKATEQDSKTLSAIDAATQISKESSRYSYSFQQLLTAMTKNISSPADRLTAEAFLQGSRGRKNGGQIAYQELENIAKTSAVLEELNTRYQAAIPAERGMAVSVSSMKSLIGTILQLGSGAKELNMSFKDLVGDAKVAKSLNSIYNDLNKFIEKNGTVTEENLKKYQKFFENKSYDNFGELLYDAIDSSSSGGQGYQNLLIELQDQLTNTFKMSADQVSATMQTIETNTRAVGESALEQVLNVGASIESNAAIMDQLNSNTRKHMDLSSAITEEIALFTSSAAAYGTIVETLNTLTSRDGNVTDKVVALSSSFATLKSALSAADTVFDDFNAKIDIFGKSSPFTVGGLTALSGAAFGLYQFGSSAVQAYKDSTIEAQIKLMSENAVYAKEQANIAAESYDSLLSSQANYNTLLEELYTLRPGSADFGSTLFTTNQAALDLVNRYGLEATRGGYGEILFDSNQMRQAVKDYEQNALNAQTRSLISSQLAQTFELQNTYDRLINTPLWDKEKNVGNLISTIGDRITGITQSMVDTIFPSDNTARIIELNPDRVKEIKTNISNTFTNLGSQVLNGAEKLVLGMAEFNILQNADVALAKIQGIRNQSDIEALLDTITDINKTTALTTDNFVDFYKYIIDNKDALKDALPGANITDYSTFKSYFDLNKITLSSWGTTDWSGIIGENGTINWKRLQQTIGEAASNIVPRSFESALKQSLGLSADATDSEVQKAIEEYDINRELAVTRLNATTSGMINSVINGEANVSDRQRMAADLIGMSGGRVLSQLMPTSLEELSTLNKTQLQQQYKELINPLNDEYLALTESQLIAQIQAEQTRQNILNTINTTAAQIGDDELKSMRTYSKQNIATLKDNLSEESDRWQKFYAYNAATTIQNLGETMLNVFSPEFLAQQFQGQNLFGDGNFAEKFGSSLSDWVLNQGYSIEQTQELSNWVSKTYNAFGQQTAQYVFSALTSGIEGQFNPTTLRALQQLNLDSSLTGINSLKNLKNTITDDNLRSVLGDIYDRAISDIGGESGLFSKLLNSSDFAKVAKALETVYETNGNLSASLVQALTSKSASLNAYLSASDTANAGSIAKLFNAMFSGQISQSAITSSVIDAFGYAGSGSGTHAERQEEISDFEFEDSSANIVNKFLKNTGAQLKAGFSSGYLSDPAVMQIMNMMPESTKNAYYAAMAKGRDSGWNAETTLKYFMSSNQNFATLYKALTNKKHPAEFQDLLNYVVAETGLFSLGDEGLFFNQGGQYGLNDIKSEFSENGKYAGYANWLKENYSEFTDLNGNLNLDLLFNTSQGFQRLMADYLSGTISTKSGVNEGTAFFDPEDAAYWATIFTEHTASSLGQDQVWDLNGAKIGLQQLIEPGFVNKDVLKAWWEQNVNASDNQEIRDWGFAGDFDSFYAALKRPFEGRPGVTMVDADTWQKWSAENVTAALGTTGRNLFNVLQNENATFIDSEGKTRLDFSKAYDYFTNVLGMDSNYALSALDSLASRYKEFAENLGTYILGDDGLLKFVSYKDWKAQADNKDKDVSEFWEKARGNVLEEVAKSFSTDLFAGIKTSLGLDQIDTKTIEEEFAGYFKTFVGEGAAATFRDFINNALGNTNIGKMITGIGEGIKGIFKGVVDFVTDEGYDQLRENGATIPGIIGEVFKDGIADIFQGGPKLAKKIAELMGLKTEITSQYAPAQPKSTGQLWKEIFSNVIERARGSIEGALSGLDNLIENFDFYEEGEIGTSLLNLGKQVTKRLFAGLATLFSEDTEFTVDKLGNFLKDGKASDFKEVLGAIWEPISTFMTDTIPTWLNTGFNFLNDTFFGDANSKNPSKYKGDTFGKSLNNVFNDILASIGNVFTGGKENGIYKWDQKNGLTRDGEQAGLSNVIGDVLNGVIPTLASSLGNLILDTPKYSVLNGKLAKSDENGKLVEAGWDEYITDIFNGFSDFTGDLFAGLMGALPAPEGYTYNKETKTWQQKDKDGNKKPDTKELQFVDVFSQMFGLDNPNSTLGKVTSKVTEIINYIGDAPKKITNWLDKSLDNFKFENNKWWKFYDDGSKPGGDWTESNIFEAFGAQLSNWMTDLMNGPIMQGLSGLFGDVGDIVTDTHTGIIKPFIDKLRHDLGRDIAKALIPDELEEELLADWDTDPENKNGIFAGLKIGLDHIKESLTNGFMNLFNSDSYRFVNGKWQTLAFNEDGTPKFNKNGTRATTEATFGEALTAFLGETGSNLMHDLGTEFLAMLTGEQYNWSKEAGGYILEGQEPLGGSGRGFGKILGGSIKDLFANMIAPQGYSAFNGQLYRDTDMTGGIPNKDATGANPMTVLLADLVSGLSGQNYVAKGNQLFLANQDGNIINPNTPFSFGDFLGSSLKAGAQGIFSSLLNFVNPELAAQWNNAINPSLDIDFFKLLTGKEGAISVTDSEAWKNNILQSLINDDSIQIDKDKMSDYRRTQLAFRQEGMTFEDNDNLRLSSDKWTYLNPTSTQELMEYIKSSEAFENADVDQRMQWAARLGLSYDNNYGFFNPLELAAISQYQSLNPNTGTILYHGYQGGKGVEDYNSWVSRFLSDKNTSIDSLKELQGQYDKDSQTYKDLQENIQYREEYNHFFNDYGIKGQYGYLEGLYSDLKDGSMKSDQLTYFQKSILQHFDLIDENLNPMGEFFTTAMDNGATTLEEAINGSKGEEGQTEGQKDDEKKEGYKFEPPATSSSGGGNDRGGGPDAGGSNRGGSSNDKNIFGSRAEAVKSIFQNGGDVRAGADISYNAGNGVVVHDTVTEEDVWEAGGSNYDASGQNNARLLAYASGKQGHIAITGELGPELRIKSDGSMDILGKKGREYAWVDPDDRIYTAQQSAGILKSNKIPGLDALAKGINNFIPGYASDYIAEHRDSSAHASAQYDREVASGSRKVSTSTSGGTRASSSGGTHRGGSGGGGGGSRGGGGGGGGAAIDPRYDPNTLKLRDVVERYYTILQKIDDITKAVERFSKVADRAWGQERIRALEQQNDMQRKQYEAQKKYINEIEEYLDADQQALITMVHEFVDAWNETAKTNEEIAAINWAGAEFDENGNFTNYRDFVELLVERFNTQGYYANSQEQFKFQEQLKDIQFYTDSLNLYQEQRDALEDIKNSILDTAIQTITYEVEYKLQLSGNVERILNFQADKYKNDVYNAAKYLELLDQKADLTYQNLANVREGIFNIIGEYAGDSMTRGTQHSLQELGIYPEFDRFKIPEELLQEITSKDEQDAEKLKKLQQEQGQKRTELIGTWIDQLYQENAEEATEIEKMLKFSYDETKAGKFEYDYNWRDTYSSWNDYYKEVINKTNDESIRAIENYDTIVKKLNKVIDFAKVRTEVDKWLEELRIQDAKAAEEIDKMVQRDEEGNILNYTDVIYRINEANKLITEEAQKTLMEDEDAFFEWFSKALETSEFTNDLTNATVEQFSQYMEQEYSYLTSLRDYADKVLSSLSDQVKNFQKDMKTAIDEFDYYEAVYEEFGNIIDLTNRHMTDITKEFFDTLNSKVADNAINKIKVTATNYHLLEKQLADVSKQYETVQAQADAATGIQQEELQQYADKLKQELTVVNSQFEDAHKNFLSAWEDALNKLSEVYEKTIEEAGKNFEKAFSPMFTTFALLQAQFDRERALGDLYVDNYQRIHDLSKLNRDIENSIIDTDNLNGKERLRDLQKEINDLQEEGTELSEYDLDILDKKYQLELARQALEDAKDAKSMVRLARDNNGNWSYVYTANQDDIDKAEQDYEDAIQAMEQANEDYIKSLEDQVLQVREKALQEMQSLNKDDFESIEAYEAAMRNIADSANKTMAYLSQQMNNAFGNNNYLLNPDIVDVKYGIQNHGLTTNTGDTLLGQLLGITDMGQISDGLANDLEDLLVKPSIEAYKKYVQDQTEIYNAAEHNMATIGKDFTDEMDTISNISNDQVDVVNTVADRIQSKFAETVNFVEDFILTKLDNMLKRIRQYDQINQQLTKLIERSGENEPTEKIQFTGRVDSLADLQLLKKELTEHGILRVFEDMSGIDPDYIKSETEKMQEVTPLIEEWIKALKETTDTESKKILDEKLNIKKDANGNISNYYDVIGQLLGVKEDDKTKKTLNAIRKWQERDSKDTVLTDAEKANYVKGKGLWTTLSSDSDEAKAYFKRVLERIAYNQISVELAGDQPTEAEASMIEYYIDTYGGVWVTGKHGEKFYDDKAKWRTWYEEHKLPVGGGGGGGGSSGGGSGGMPGLYNDNGTPKAGITKYGLAAPSWGSGWDTGGYTGRWQSADTGMYTGEWPGGSVRRNGRLAWLHQKELVLNAHDTENFLDAMSIVRQLDNLTNWMANGLGDLIMPNVSTETSELEQNVHIEAEFPNVTNHSEIEQAFNNLVNMASQYANRK